MKNHPLTVLRHHVSGAIERGEKTAIVEQPAAGEAAHTPKLNAAQFTHLLKEFCADKGLCSIGLVSYQNGDVQFSREDVFTEAIRRCNAHAGLVAALESLAVLSTDGLPYCPDIRVVKAARAALNSAKEGL